MTVYVSSVILRSLRMIGEKTRGDSLDANESTECLYELNSMLDSWGTQRTLCYQVLQESFSLTSGTNSYTIGSGATFNTGRPTKIVDPCFVRDGSNFDSPVKILTSESYGSIVLKNVGTTYPTYLYYDHAFDASGYGTIKVYPAPTSNLTLFINSWKQLGAISTISSPISFPPGYQLAIESNFAIHLAAGLTPISAELAKIAKDSMAAIRGLNLPTQVMALDYGLPKGQRMNVITGP